MSSQAPAVDTYRLPRLAARCAAGLALIFIGMKAWLYTETGAASFLASLLDSGMDLALSSVMWLALKWAGRPADARHRHGYGKIEALIGCVQGLIAGSAGILLGWQAGLRLQNPVELNPSLFDMGLCAAMVVGTCALVAFQTYIIKKTGSLAVRADRAHYLGDIGSNAALLILVLVNGFQSVPWLDSVITALIAMALLSMSAEIIGHGVYMLLDREVSEEKREEFFVAASMVSGVDSIHDLRVIDTGMKLRISLDVEMDGDLTLTEAHDIAKNVENALLTLAPDAEIMIHMDPIGDREDSRHENLKPMHFT
jgi:ferrous-iron efflux pump FieF